MMELIVELHLEASDVVDITAQLMPQLGAALRSRHSAQKSKEMLLSLDACGCAHGSCWLMEWLILLASAMRGACKPCIYASAVMLAYTSMDWLQALSLAAAVANQAEEPGPWLHVVAWLHIRLDQPAEAMNVLSRSPPPPPGGPLAGPLLP